LGEKELNNNVFEVIFDDTDEEFTRKIKELLLDICYGKENADLGTITFEETIKELNKRISTKTQEQKAGMIGELLFHLKSYELFKKHAHISVYFNKEERSVKKGFDVLLFDGKKVWYCEVKSREDANNEDITLSHIKKLKEAIKDAKEKFNSENENYWLTAKTNIVNIEEKSLKKQIADILTKDINKNVKKDTMGVSVAFQRELNSISKDSVEEYLKTEEDNFDSLVAICITHEDYEKIIKMLKEISDGN